MRYLLVFFIFPVFLSAQPSNSLDIFGAQGVSYEPNSFLRSLDLESNYSPINVSRLGFGASFKLGQRTYLRTSIQLSQYGYRWKSNEIRWGTQHDGDGGFDPNLDPDLPGSIEITHRDYYAEGIVTGGYQFSTRSNWKPFAEIGLGLGGYLISGSRFVTNDFLGDVDDSLQFERIEVYHSLAYLVRAGLGTDYTFNDRVGVYGMAVFQRHLRTINSRGTARIYPWQASLELGVRLFVGG